MLPRSLALSLCLLVVTFVPALASDEKPGPIAAAAARAITPADAQMPSWAAERTEKRPIALSAMYGTYGALQVMDVVSTRRAIAAGATEQNPLVGRGDTGRLIAVKAAAGVSTIFFAERMWKRNKVGAVIVMAALNGASAAIVARNLRNARR